MKWQAQAALRQMQKEGGQEHEDPDRLYADEADDEGHPKPRGRGRGRGKGRGRGRRGTPRQPDTSRGPKGDDAKGEKKNKDGEAQEEDDKSDQDDADKDETTVDQTASDNKRAMARADHTPKRKTRRTGAGFKKRSMSKSPAHPKKKVKSQKAAEAPNMDEDCKWSCYVILFDPWQVHVDYEK